MVESGSPAIYVDEHMPAVEIARERFPTVQAVVERLRDRRSFGNELALGHHPSVQRIDNGSGSLLAAGLSSIRLQFGNVTLDVVECAEIFQRLFGDLALVVDVQLVEFPARVSGTSDFRDTQFESSLVAAIVIPHELVTPRSHELSGMFASTAAGEVVAQPSDRRMASAMSVKPTLPRPKAAR